MAESKDKRAGPVKLPLKTMDAVRGLLEVKPPPKPAKGTKKPLKPKKG